MMEDVGDRVLINTLGDIRVRPTIFEVNLHTSESMPYQQTSNGKINQRFCKKKQILAIFLAFRNLYSHTSNKKV